MRENYQDPIFPCSRLLCKNMEICGHPWKEVGEKEEEAKSDLFPEARLFPVLKISDLLINF